ncbi:SRPBCC family protein [Aquimarina algiphila]|uniref:SRPBCC family protein n=1 Tax=Aquimarina algiphila TaxID=2047982 RepID=UPI002330B994|nr:SRPBCC family protein [Aquimarina algiphila]
MSVKTNHFAKAAMLIRKPISDVFDAFIDPEITSKFWFTKGSEILKEGKTTDWTWEMFNHTVSVLAILIITNEKIRIQWGDDPEAIVEWTFKSLGASKTFVTITNTGFKGTPDELISQIRDATGGFTWVLAGLKSYLEHNIELNLIADRYPKELN